MKVIISYGSSEPIYEQIYAQLKKQIIGAEIAPDEPLPSIRALAKELRVSVITTKRAYDELEKSGLIYTVAGRGSFAARTSRQQLREEYLRCIEEHMVKIRELAELCGLAQEELSEMYKEMKGR